MSDRDDKRVELVGRKRRAEDGELDITPMIDIVFLLLAFFVVVSKMDPTTVVNMPKAKFGETVAEKTAVIIVIGESDTDDPMVFKGKSRTPGTRCLGGIEEIEDDLEEYVKQQMESDPVKVNVIIKAERRVKYRHLDIVKRAVSRNLDKEIHALHVGIEDK